MTSDITRPRIAFLGLGIMGAGMAGRLLDAGFPLTVHNRSAGRARALEVKGALVADSPRAAASGADIVFSMVADDAASRATWDGDSGALAGMRQGSIVVECRPLTVGRVRRLAD